MRFLASLTFSLIVTAFSASANPPEKYIIPPWWQQWSGNPAEEKNMIDLINDGYEIKAAFGSNNTENIGGSTVNYRQEIIFLQKGQSVYRCLDDSISRYSQNEKNGVDYCRPLVTPFKGGPTSGP